MKKGILRMVLLVMTMFAFATIVSAEGWPQYTEPVSKTAAEGYYLVKETIGVMVEGDLVPWEGFVYEYEFDTNGRMIRSSKKMDTIDEYPGGKQITEYFYDSAGRLIQSVAGAGTDYTTAVTYQYNNVGQMTKSESTASYTDWVFITEYNYNSEGLLMSAQSNTGITTTYAYNAKGQCIQCEANEGEIVWRWVYEYDALGNNTRICLYAPDWETGEYYLWAVLEYSYEKLQEAPTGGRFEDVPANEYYAEPVNWAVSLGITNGTSETTFSPDNSCTRAQAVTFLWRAAGSLEPTSASNPFVDVSEGDYYYKAVLWAVEKGITTGTDAAHFSPDVTCNRAQIVTFLHRYEGSPAASGESFNDVPASEYYYAPVIWAVAKGVTNGTGAGNFSPMADCTRGQIVTFLYRDMVG